MKDLVVKAVVLLLIRKAMAERHSVNLRRGGRGSVSSRRRIDFHRARYRKLEIMT